MLLRSMRGPDGLGTIFKKALPKEFFAPTGIPLQAVHAASEHVVALLVLHLHRVIPIRVHKRHTRCLGAAPAIAELYLYI